MRAPFVAEIPNVMCNTYGRGLFLGVNHGPNPKGGAPALPNFGGPLSMTALQGRSQPRISEGAPASGRWARGWVRTNVSPSAAEVRGNFCIFLIQYPAF